MTKKEIITFAAILASVSDASESEYNDLSAAAKVAFSDMRNGI